MKHTEEQKTLHSVKFQLLKYMVVHADGYVISIPADEWHKIFKSEELNKCGITYDKRYKQ